jgi:hypothetical protein
MIHSPKETLDKELEQQPRLVRGLMAALYVGDGAAPDEPLLEGLAEARRILREQQSGRDAERVEVERGQAGPRKMIGVPLGPGTTGLRVVATIRLKPIPTGVFHLLGSETDPPLTVTAKNVSHEPMRICVTAFIEGLSARRRRDKT